MLTIYSVLATMAKMGIVYTILLPILHKHFTFINPTPIEIYLLICLYSTFNSSYIDLVTVLQEPNEKTNRNYLINVFAVLIVWGTLWCIAKVGGVI